jgi:cytochrome c556
MKKLLTLLTLTVMVWACSNQKDTEPEAKSEIVMAEFSELALLMKEIHRDAKDWRSTLVAGELVTDSVAIYEALVTSTPTKAEVKGPVFEGYAAAYQEKLDAFLAARDQEMAKSSYNQLVTACVSCHQSYCPGPIPTIEKLYISTASASE